MPALTRLSLPHLSPVDPRRYISGRDPIAQHIVPSTEYPLVDFVGTGNGAFCDQNEAQNLPSQNLIPQGSLKFVSGDNTGFVTVTHSGEAVNGTSQITVNFHDSIGNLLYAFSKGNPRHMGRATAPPSKSLTSWSSLAYDAPPPASVSKRLQSERPALPAQPPRHPCLSSSA